VRRFTRRKTSSGQPCSKAKEWSRRSQPSARPELTSNRLAADPRLNINTQPWSQPVMFQNFSGSLVRYTIEDQQRLELAGAAGTQRLVNDDLLAYPLLWLLRRRRRHLLRRSLPSQRRLRSLRFRSLTSGRTTHAAQWHQRPVANGCVHTPLERRRARQPLPPAGQPQADNNNAAGTGNRSRCPASPAVPSFTDPYTNRSERSTEWFVTDAIRWSGAAGNSWSACAIMAGSRQRARN
jgi:iron complex outermembrane receptor protein